mmetsp:Transcript_33649/g.85076  ORF Transcript_33649/g.85076 Transcript_33649/m.85076 type:complete len:224 (-) Transcript_33649:31-702(-)
MLNLNNTVKQLPPGRQFLDQVHRLGILHHLQEPDAVLVVQLLHHRDLMFQEVLVEVVVVTHERLDRHLLPRLLVDGNPSSRKGPRSEGLAELVLGGEVCGRLLGRRRAPPMPRGTASLRVTCSLHSLYPSCTRGSRMRALRNLLRSTTPHCSCSPSAGGARDAREALASPPCAGTDLQPPTTPSCTVPSGRRPLKRPPCGAAQWRRSSPARPPAAAAAQTAGT